ncbi:MAG: hypothetical protein Q9208_000171 [Pyrenodesmia sp. 3 TL-2023]
MPSQNIIDLSLSTDDEAPAATKGPSKTLLNSKSDAGYGSLPDQFLDIDGGSREKRKLSPPEPVRQKATSSGQRNGLVDSTPFLSTETALDHFLPLDDDPIIWTSSPKQKEVPSQGRAHSNVPRPASLSDSEDDLPDEQWHRMAQQRSAQVPETLQDTTGLAAKRLASGNKRASLGRRDKKSPTSWMGSPTKSAKESRNLRPSTGAVAKKAKITEEEKVVRAEGQERARAAAKEAKSREKEGARTAAKEAKEREKAEDKERRRLLKEEQAREKQKDKDRAEANKLKLDKKLSTPEMIVDLPISIDGSTIDTQIKEFLRQIGVEVTSYQSPVTNIVKWRRKVESRFNVKSGCRELLAAKEIDAEKHVMCLISANELVDLLASDTETESQSLDEHVAGIKSAFSDCIPIYMIEGLDAWIRRNRNARNRAYTAAVRSQLDSNAGNSSATGSTASSRRKKQRTEVVDEDMIEDALLRLQVVHNCLIHHAAISVETAEWVAHFTEQISQIPYRQEQMARDAAFCMESGQVKSGKDAEEVYTNMLLANVRVTNPIAHGIAAKYPNVSALVRGLEEKGPTALEHLKKHANRDAPLAEETDWATHHLASEHHISNFDPGAFFTLHDFDSSLSWSADEIRRMYGLDDESARGVDEARKAEVVRKTLEVFDSDGDGVVGRGEWMEGWRAGKRLQDFGLGPGHHGDDEYEYEIHHFEKFHDESGFPLVPWLILGHWGNGVKADLLRGCVDTKEEDLTHPEDIAHFRKHDENEAAAEHQEELDRMPIVEQNIPQKFRRY